jgi:mRNA interferase MazF
VHTTTFNAGDIVRVPYPHVERRVVVQRPAVVFSRHPVGPDGLLLWTVMITNAERERWPGDVLIPDWQNAGLIIPSKIRTAKVSSVQTAQAHYLGRLPEPLWQNVWTKIRETVG